MLKLKAIEDMGFLKKNEEYYIGGMISESRRLVCMTLDKISIIGSYPSEVFGFTSDEIYNMIVSGK